MRNFKTGYYAWLVTMIFGFCSATGKDGFIFSDFAPLSMRQIGDSYKFTNTSGDVIHDIAMVIVGEEKGRRHVVIDTLNPHGSIMVSANEFDDAFDKLIQYEKGAAGKVTIGFVCKDFSKPSSKHLIEWER